MRVTIIVSVERKVSKSQNPGSGPGDLVFARDVSRDLGSRDRRF